MLRQRLATRSVRTAAHALVPLLATLCCAPARADPPPETATPCNAASDPSAPRILVTATGARRVAGNITFTLYGDRPAAFLAHGGSIAISRVTLAGPAAEACFAVSRPGIYAVAVYHDENNNHHFDRSWIGLPLEGYGFSNDAPVFMAPPSFASVRFVANSGETRQRIRLRYGSPPADGSEVRHRTRGKVERTSESTH